MKQRKKLGLICGLFTIPACFNLISCEKNGSTNKTGPNSNKNAVKSYTYNVDKKGIVTFTINNCPNDTFITCAITVKTQDEPGSFGKGSISDGKNCSGAPSFTLQLSKGICSLGSDSTITVTSVTCSDENNFKYSTTTKLPPSFYCP